jgi:hypothetical protein
MQGIDFTVMTKSEDKQEEGHAACIGKVRNGYTVLKWSPGKHV